MPMNEVNPRLRLINKTNAVAKINLIVPPGDELEVSEEVAAQLPQAFVGAGTEAAEVAVPYPPVEPEAADVEPVVEVKAKPAPKRRTRKS